jgi:integral membrane protein (TIGR01906 family)
VALAVVRALATALFVLAIPVALIGTNVRFLASEDKVYTYAIDHYNAPTRTGISRDELLKANAELRGYFNNGDKYVSITVKQGDNIIPLFNDREVLHLKDVKAVLGFVNHLQEIALVYIMAYVVGVFVWARERPLRKLAILTLSGSLLTIGVIVSLGLVAVAGFDSAFEQFHHIAFRNNLWELSMTDHLIQMFPDGFWYDLTMFLGILTVAEAVIIGGASVLHLTLAQRTRHARQADKQGSSLVPQEGVAGSGNSEL